MLRGIQRDANRILMGYNWIKSEYQSAIKHGWLGNPQTKWATHGTNQGKS
jgi:hypothetical protein